MTATIIGEEKLLRKLTIIPQKMRQAIKHEMGHQADEMVDMMRRLVPVDDGDLRDSIGWRWGGKAPRGSEAVGEMQSQRGDLTLTIYAGNSKVFWATFQEFGTRKMAANPFFFVTWRASRKGAGTAIRAETRRAAKQVAAGG